MRASKRSATSDLNHENWNQEEEVEDAGTYEQAPADVIGRRKIRVARRRGVTSEDSGTGGLFKSFTGFGSTGLSGASVPNFGTVSSGKTSDGEPPVKRSQHNDFSGSVEKSGYQPASNPIFQFGFASSTASGAAFSFGKGEGQSNAAQNKASKAMTSNEAVKDDVSTRDRHLHMLRSLNLSVNKWISSHVEKDPYCDLTPVFADYEKHLKEIERQYPYDTGDASDLIPETRSKEKTLENKSNVNSTPPHAITESTSSNGKGSGPLKGACGFLSARGSIATVDKALNKRPTVAPNFGLSSAQLTSVSEDKEDSSEDEKEGDKEDVKEKGTEKEIEGKKSTTSLPFGGSKPFTFGFDAHQKAKPTEDEPEKPAPTLFSGMNFNFGGNIASTSSIASQPFSFGLGGGSSYSSSSTFVTAAAKEEEEPYEPPKAEVKEIKEEGAVITKRCKLFYKSEDAWNDKGVGNLHLKPIDQGKVQAIIRADTNLGTILLNVMLTKIIPITRQKNNLTLLCVPSPPMKPLKGDEEAPKVPIPLLVRFKTETDCEEVLKEIERLREKKTD